MLYLLMNRDKSEARSSPKNELALTPALSPRRGRIVVRWFETTNDWIRFKGPKRERFLGIYF
jgi:hypothetical protein